MLRETITVCLAVASLAAVMELLLVTLGSILSRTRKQTSPPQPHPGFRMAVLVPAHDEARSIEATVADLMQECGNQATLYVVADNCHDQTAEIAARAGARVLVRIDPSETGKAAALRFAFARLEREGFDGVLVLDADSEVSDGLIAQVIDQLAQGADAVQCRNVISNPESSARASLLALALAAFNGVRPRGRQYWGLSAGPLANGFALPFRTLRAVPFSTKSIVEDLEYHLLLVEAGLRTSFLDSATIRTAVPVGGQASAAQRARWEGGRLGVVLTWIPRLVWNFQLRCLEPLLELLTPPLAIYSLLLASWMLVSPAGWWRWTAIAAFALLCVHVAAAIADLDRPALALRALLFAPLHLLWKVTLIPKLFQSAKPDAVWAEEPSEPRIAVIQHGDYRSAIEMLESGRPEPYFGMRYSVSALRGFVRSRPHCIVSLDAPPYQEAHGSGLWLGIPIPATPPWLPRTLKTLRWRVQILEALRRFRPTHVLLRNGNPLIGAAVLAYCQRNHVSVLTMLTNMMERWRGWHNRYYLNRYVELLNQPNVFLVGNHKPAAARSLIAHGVIPEKVVAWDYPSQRNPASFPVKELPASGRPFEIVYAGAMIKSKGLGDLILAVNILHDEGLPVMLNAYGDGRDWNFFKTVADGRIVHFAGQVGNDEIFHAMRQAAVVCVPTRRDFPEAMPLVLTEALSSRTPTVVSDHPVMQTSLRNEEGVLFAQSGNAYRIAAALRRILTDPELYHKLSETTLTAYERLECKTEFADLLQRWASARIANA